MDEPPKPRIYVPPQESEMLPGIPFWLLAYGLLLGVMGVGWVFIVVIRIGNRETHLYYGAEFTGIAISLLVFLAGVFVATSAYGLARLKLWGLRLVHLLCWGWVALSVVLWLVGIVQVRTEDRVFFILATVLGFSSFLAFGTINQLLRGDGVQDLIDPPMIGIPVAPRMVRIPSIFGAGIMGSAIVYLVLPIVVAVVAVFGMFIVLSLLVHHPSTWNQASRAIMMLVVLILVGGAVNHFFLLELLGLERPRFE